MGWEVVLHSIMLRPSPGARPMGDHTIGGGVLTRNMGAYFYIVSLSSL